MKKFPKITLPIGTEFVFTNEIPLLIADALYPEVKFFELPVLDLYKIARKSDLPANLINKVFQFSRAPDWYSPITDKDYQVLQGIWVHLPELNFPLSRADWMPYARAFIECGTKISFDLKENCVNWLVEPNGYQKQFFEINNYSSNVVGMWDNDDADESKLILQCGMAEMEHIVLLRDAIRQFEVTQFDHITHAKTGAFQSFGKVPVEDFEVYAKKFNIVVCVNKDDTRVNLNNNYQANGNETNSPSQNNVPEDALPTKPAPSEEIKAEMKKTISSAIPGTLPNTAIGKFAIKAAWQIECEKKRRAFAQEVIAILQEWVGDEPLLQEKIPHGVKWVTTKGKLKNYYVEACAKTLETWNSSRA